MKTKNLLSLLAIAGVMFFASCKKDDPNPLTKEQAEIQLTTIDNNYSTDFTELNATQGFSIETQLNGMTLPFGNLPKKSSANPETILNNQNSLIAKPDFTKKLLGDTPDFTFVPGTYTYNKALNNFTKTASTPTDKMVLLFPFPKTNATNNATLTISDYLSTTILGKIFPTQYKGEIKIGDQVVWTLVATASYTSLTNYNYSAVTTIGKFVFTNQYSININITTSQITSTSLDELKKDGVVVYRFSSNGLYKYVQNNLTAVIDAKIVIKEIEIRLTYTFDFSTVLSVTDPNTIQKISVYTTNGVKIGDIKQVKVGNEWVAYIFFNNGESKPVSDYFHNLLTIINEFMKELFVNPTK